MRVIAGVHFPKDVIVCYYWNIKWSNWILHYLIKDWRLKWIIRIICKIYSRTHTLLLAFAIPPLLGKCVSTTGYNMVIP